MTLMKTEGISIIAAAPIASVIRAKPPPEGPPIAREILTGLGFEKGQVEEICEIIGHHHSPGKINTTNFKILYDAEWLVNLKDE